MGACRSRCLSRGRWRGLRIAGVAHKVSAVGLARSPRSHRRASHGGSRSAVSSHRVRPAIEGLQCCGSENPDKPFESILTARPRTFTMIPSTFGRIRADQEGPKPSGVTTATGPQPPIVTTISRPKGDREAVVDQNGTMRVWTNRIRSCEYGRSESDRAGLENRNPIMRVQAIRIRSCGFKRSAFTRMIRYRSPKLA